MNPQCFVCGNDVRDGCFAQMDAAHRKVFLCSPDCARMFFEVEPPPAHDHRARHNFQRAKSAILRAAQSVLSQVRGVNELFPAKGPRE